MINRSSMNQKDLNTEQKILEAAKDVFVRKGLEGARMQEIADEAHINKALLHYYFRSKDKLFEAVFRETFFKLLPNVIDLIQSDNSLFEKIRLFVENYINIINENPLLPSFVLHELSRNPQRVVDMIKSSGINPLIFVQQIQDEIEKGTIVPVNPLHFLVNMLAMCIFPFVAKPILQGVIFQDDKQHYDAFIQERKTEVADFIINSIKKR